jgi:hypothetical protein
VPCSGAFQRFHNVFDYHSDVHTPRLCYYSLAGELAAIKFKTYNNICAVLIHDWNLSVDWSEAGYIHVTPDTPVRV